MLLLVCEARVEGGGGLSGGRGDWGVEYDEEDLYRRSPGSQK